MPLSFGQLGDMEAGMPAHFPYSIVDREPQQESQLVDFFFNLLEFLTDEQLTVKCSISDCPSVSTTTATRMRQLSEMDTREPCLLGFDAQHRELCLSLRRSIHGSMLDLLSGFCAVADKKLGRCAANDEIEGENAPFELFQVLQQLHKHQERSRSALTLHNGKNFCFQLYFFPSDETTDRRRIEQAI